eukprot:6767600-Pyramimonas_sp.AAC.1
MAPSPNLLTKTCEKTRSPTQLERSRTTFLATAYVTNFPLRAFFRLGAPTGWVNGALALRVMSSIRINATVPIVMLAIKKCSVDSAVNVRKAATHAIPKAYALDPSMQEELIESIDQMLGDRTPTVVSSAVAAFVA